MVHEPSFFTLAGHEVRRLRSRSVAVMFSLSAAASNRKLERIGMVVLRSTTPCVAVNSFNRSDLLTVISILSPRVCEDEAINYATFNSSVLVLWVHVCCHRRIKSMPYFY